VAPGDGSEGSGLAGLATGPNDRAARSSSRTGIPHTLRAHLTPARLPS
jgi:hypothetical protein